MIGQTLGHYRIEDKLGEGGMGEVYLAFDTELDRQVALKVLPQEVADSHESLTRFRGEAKALASLSHPNIVTIYSVESVEGVHFLTMELLEGKDLSDYIPPGGLSLERFFKIAIPLADALSAAHEKKIIHRDLKPGNIIVTDKSQVKVVDFGLAKALHDVERTIDEKAPTQPMTEEGRVLGTVPYMAPEQLLGREADRRSDIFSLGILLYEAVTGERPFKGATKVEIQSAILHLDPQPVDEVKPEAGRDVARLIDLCLKKDPEARLQSAKDIRNQLSALHHEVSTGSSPPKPVEMPQTGRSKVLRYLLPILVASLVAVGILLIWNPNGPPPDGPTVGEEAQARLDQGEAYELRGLTRENLREAEDRYRRALRLEPGNPAIEARLARVLVDLQLVDPDADQRREASELAHSVLDRDPDNIDALLALGNLAFSDNQLEMAEQRAQRVIDLAPQDPFGYTLLGRTLVMRGDLDAGVEQVRKGVQLAGTDTRPRLALAWVLWQQGRSNEAAAEYERVLEYHPDSPGGLNNLAIIYGEQGRYLEAIPLLRRLLRITDDADAAFNLANCYFYLDRLDEAIVTYEQVLEIDPDYHWAEHGLAETHEKLGDQTLATGFFERAIEGYDRRLAHSGPDEAYLAPRAVCAAKLGRFDEARENLAEAERLSPGAPTVLFMGAQVHALAGDESTMLEYIERAIDAGYPRQAFDNDLAFSAYREDPEFRRILESEGTP